MKTKAPTAYSKTRKDRVEYLRNFIDNHEVRKYIAILDTAKNKKEFHAVQKQSDEIIHNRRDLDEVVSYAIYDAEHEAEDRISKERKQADKLRIATSKREKLAAKEQLSNTLNKYRQYPILKDAIETVSETFRPDLIKSYHDNKINRLNRFIEGIRIEVPEPIWEGRGKYDLINRDLLNLYHDRIGFVAPYHQNGILKPNYREMIQAKAERYAECVLESLREKLAFKLGPVIDRKGGGTVTPHGGVNYHVIHISFPDGSGFTIQSQIVHAVSKNGVFFSRHPMTFHNVTYEDGTRMKTPSAARMKKEFGVDINNNDKEMQR